MPAADIIDWLKYFIDPDLPDDERFCLIGDTARRMRAAGTTKRTPSAAGSKNAGGAVGQTTVKQPGGAAKEKTVKDLDKVELNGRDTPTPPPPPDDNDSIRDAASDSDRSEVLPTGGSRSRPSRSTSSNTDVAPPSATSGDGAPSRSASTAPTSVKPHSADPPPPTPPRSQSSTNKSSSGAAVLPRRGTPSTTLSFRPPKHIQVSIFQQLLDAFSDLSSFV